MKGTEETVAGANQFVNLNVKTGVAVWRLMYVNVAMGTVENTVRQILMNVLWGSMLARVSQNALICPVGITVDANRVLKVFGMNSRCMACNAEI